MIGLTVQTEPMTIHRNGHWSVLITIRDRATGNLADITNWNFDGSLKKNPTDATPAAVFTFTKPGPTGQVRATIDATARAAIPCGPFPDDPESQYQFDFRAIINNLPYPYLRGPAQVVHGGT